jgi:hypothetical protein
LEYLRTRRIFKDLDPRCLAAFVQDCLVPIKGSVERGGGSSGGSGAVRLAFPPAIEAAIYRTFPLDLHPAAASRIGQYDHATAQAPPGWLLYSATHALTSPRDIAYLRTVLPSLQFSQFPQVLPDARSSIFAASESSAAPSSHRALTQRLRSRIAHCERARARLSR